MKDEMEVTLMITLTTELRMAMKVNFMGFCPLSVGLVNFAVSLFSYTGVNPHGVLILQTTQAIRGRRGEFINADCVKCYIVAAE